MKSVDEAEEEMDRVDDLKLEIDGRQDKFAYVVEAGDQMVNEGHHATEEVGTLHFLAELYGICDREHTFKYTTVMCYEMCPYIQFNFH